MRQVQNRLTKPKLFVELEKTPSGPCVVKSSSDILIHFLRIKQNVEVSQDLLKLPQTVQDILLVDKDPNVPCGIELASGTPNHSIMYKELQKKIETIPIR